MSLIQLNKLFIRPAEFADAPKLAAVKIAESGGNPESVEAYFRGILSPDSKQIWKYFIALNDAIPVGSAAVRLYNPAIDENMYGTSELLPHGWFLRAVRVHPEWRQQGVARSLTMARLEWLCKNTPCCFVFIDDENKVTLPMYRDLGFAEVSRGWTYSDPDQVAKSIRGVLLKKDFF